MRPRELLPPEILEGGQIYRLGLVASGYLDYTSRCLKWLAFPERF